MKKISILLYVSFFLTLQVFAQSTGRSNNEIGRTNSNETARQNEQIVLRQADYLFNSGNFEAAIFALEEGFSLNPNSSQILLERALLKRRMGMDNEAEQDIRRAEMINPYAANLFGYNGGDNRMYVLSSNPIAATTDLTSYKRLGYYYNAMDKVYLTDSDQSAIIEPLEELIMQIENEEYELALITAKKTSSDFPESALAQDLYGVILLKNEDYPAAKAAFERATQLDPNFAIAWYNLGRAENMLGEQTIAKNHLGKAIGLQEDLTKAYFDRALLYKKNGQPEKAIEDYTTIINLKGNEYPEAYLNRGLTRKLLGDFQGALTDINHAIDNQVVDTAEPYLNRGNLHMVFGFPAKAVADYTKALQLGVEEAEVYYNRGLAFLLLYDNASSCADLEKSRDLGFSRAEEMLNYFCGD